ncbi:MAG: M28 family peptidase [Symbiobacteriaceae bacterium]|nr:M28 family peptidase [Symbiobacteriaceae bacterium]
MGYTVKGYVNPYARFNLNRLIDLVAIYAPSKMEEPVAEYLIPILTPHCTHIERDKEGNLCAWKPGDSGTDTIVLCAHMDTVFFPEMERHFLVEDGYLMLDQSQLPRETERGVVRPVVLGGDDRAGIEMILALVEHYNGPLNLRLLFTTREEIGGQGMHDVNPNFLEGVTCGLVLDRRNSGDIVSRIEGRTLGSKSFVQYVRHCGEQVGVRELREVGGAFSDAYFMSRRNRIPCLNLSVGYYFPHTPKEKMDLYAFNDCVGWGLRILDNYRSSILE